MDEETTYTEEGLIRCSFMLGQLSRGRRSCSKGEVTDREVKEKVD